MSSRSRGRGRCSIAWAGRLYVKARAITGSDRLGLKVDVTGGERRGKKEERVSGKQRGGPLQEDQPRPLHSALFPWL